jgi:hypothetical protein
MRSDSGNNGTRSGGALGTLGRCLVTVWVAAAPIPALGQPTDAFRAHAHCEQAYGGNDQTDHGKLSWDCSFEGDVTAKATKPKPSAQKPTGELQSILAWAWKLLGRLINDPTAILTFLLFAATAILAGFTIRLANATDKLVVGADSTSQRQLRAYVYPEIRRSHRSGAPMVVAKVKNYGATLPTRLE